MSHYDDYSDDEIDVRVRRFQRAPSPGPHYIQTIPRERHYQSGPTYLVPDRTLVTTRTRSRSRERRSSPPREVAAPVPVVIQNKIYNEQSSDDDSDHRRHRHHSSRSRASSSVTESWELERARRDLEELRIREGREQQLRDLRRTEKNYRDEARLHDAEEKLRRLEEEEKRKVNEERVRKEMELKRLEEEAKEADAKKRREKEAKDAVEKYKFEEAERHAKEKEAKERAEKEYQRRLQEDLINSGLDEKAIQAIIKKDKVKDDGKPRPTYTRMALRHLDIETLVFYKIEFEYDTEPGYILIKRWVPEWEQDILWEHTRKIRIVEKKKKKEEKVVLTIDDGKRHHHHSSHLEPEYEWVRKKERKRSKSPSMLMYFAGAKPA